MLTVAREVLDERVDPKHSRAGESGTSQMSGGRPNESFFFFCQCLCPLLAFMSVCDFILYFLVLRAHLAARMVMVPWNKTHSDQEPLQASAVAPMLTAGLNQVNGFLSYCNTATSILDHYLLKLAIWYTCLHRFRGNSSRIAPSKNLISFLSKSTVCGLFSLTCGHFTPLCWSSKTFILR